jgi:hypothetical protein
MAVVFGSAENALVLGRDKDNFLSHPVNLLTEQKFSGTLFPEMSVRNIS